MYHENKNNLLELFYSDGNERDIKNTRSHVNECTDCSNYLSGIKNTSKFLDTIEDEKPSAQVFDKVLLEVADSAPIIEKQKSSFSIIPILQIISGLAFLLLLVHIINSKISLLPVWDSIKEFWLIDSIGSIGVSVVIVLLIGTFITFSIAPILLFESEKKNSFS